MPPMSYADKHQAEITSCAEVAGTYELSPLRWVPDPTNIHNKECKLPDKSIVVGTGCDVKLIYSDGFEVSPFAGRLLMLVCFSHR